MCKEKKEINTYSIINYRFCSNFKRISCQYPLFVLALVQDSTLHLVALSCMQQILVPSFFIMFYIFTFSLLVPPLDTLIISKAALISKYLVILEVSFDINFPILYQFLLKCFLLCNHPLCFFIFLDFLAKDLLGKGSHYLEGLFSNIFFDIDV